MALQMLNRFHNQMVLYELEEGDMVEIHRGFYSHLVIYSGNEEVIHLTGNEDEFVPSTSDNLFTISGVQYDKAVVKVENLWKVVGDNKISKNNQHDSTHSVYSPKEILRRARSRIDPVVYNVIWNNCEHFVSWCRYGKNISKQADTFLSSVAVAGTVAVVGGLLMEWFKEKDDKKT